MSNEKTGRRIEQELGGTSSNDSGDPSLGAGPSEEIQDSKGKPDIAIWAIASVRAPMKTPFLR